MLTLKGSSNSWLLSIILPTEPKRGDIHSTHLFWHDKSKNKGVFSHHHLSQCFISHPKTMQELHNYKTKIWSTLY